MKASLGFQEGPTSDLFPLFRGFRLSFFNICCEHCLVSVLVHMYHARTMLAIIPLHACSSTCEFMSS